MTLYAAALQFLLLELSTNQFENDHDNDNAPEHKAR